MPHITSITRTSTHPLSSDDPTANLRRVASTEVIDLTESIERGPFIASGGSGDVYKCKLKYNFTVMPILGASPDVAVKVIKVPRLANEKKKKKRFRVSVGKTAQ